MPHAHARTYILARPCATPSPWLGLQDHQRRPLQTPAQKPIRFPLSSWACAVPHMRLDGQRLRPPRPAGATRPATEHAAFPDCNSQGAWRRKEEVTTCADSPLSFFSSPDDYMCCQPSFFCFCSSSTAAEPDSVRPVSYSLQSIKILVTYLLYPL